MGNTYIVAKKEFIDLINSKMVLIMLIWYILTFMFSFLNLLQSFDNNPGNGITLLSTSLVYNLCYYGSLLAIVLGFSSMSIELDRNAINTLLVKPIYRDTIINGKLLGTLSVVFCLILLTIGLYLCYITMFINAGIIKDFIGILPLAVLLSILCITFFFALSMLICMKFKDQSFCLLLGFLSWIFFFYLLPNQLFSGYLSYYFNSVSLNYVISGLSPYTILYNILEYSSIEMAFAHHFTEIVKLALYCFTTLILTYVSFIRRDIS